MGEGAKQLEVIETIQQDLDKVKEEVDILKESDKNQWNIINTVQDALKVMTQQATRTDEKVDQFSRSFDVYKTEQAKANGHQEGMMGIVKDTLDKVLDINKQQSVETAATNRLESTNKKEVRVEVIKVVAIAVTIVGSIAGALVKFL
ncbi:hypothetical protein [Exiguobacterium sp. s192]|uniref:hypothetical protein n=1 Tax=Exiguobacterium sp. s192 TaxID=2751206 RepID=UPI001BE86B9C|nr:hypothetical protein [Exiguobacterium sp. s192]